MRQRYEERSIEYQGHSLRGRMKIQQKERDKENDGNDVNDDVKRICE